MKEHKLLKLLDQAKPDLFPLNTHYMAQFSDHEKQQYATMLAAFITGSGFVSEAQARLFSMLCESLGLGKETSQYYQQAKNVDVDFLLNYINCIKSDKNKSSAFLIDIIVLDALGEVRNENIISEFANLLEVDLSGVYSCVSVILEKSIPNDCNFQKFIYIDDLSESVSKNKNLKVIDEFCKRFNVGIKNFLEDKCNKLKINDYSLMSGFNREYCKLTNSDVRFNFNRKLEVYEYNMFRLNSRTPFEIKSFQCSLPIYIKMPDYFSAWTSFTSR